MATDGPDPTPCNKEIMNHGTVVHITETYGANHFESLIQQVALETNTRTDWHYVGGRAVVLTLDDPTKVKEAIDRIVVPMIEIKRVEFRREHFPR
jgi:hypothetical protein